MRINLSLPLKAKDLKKVLRADSSVPDETVFTHLCSDSRIVQSGDLFIALKGLNFDGEDFTEDAIDKGAFVISVFSGDRSFTVAKTKEALFDLAHHVRNILPNLKHVVAITGSVGKSSAKEFLKSICSPFYKVHATEGNLNNHVGLPFTVLSAPRETEILILEMGMNSEGEIKVLSKCAEPTISVITNVGSAHLGFLGSREAIARAKSEIISGAKRSSPLIVDKEEPLLSNLPNLYTFSVSDLSADLTVLPIKEDIYGSHFDLIIDGNAINNLFLCIPGRHLLSTLGAALAAAAKLGIKTAEDVKIGLNSITPSSVRSGFIKFKDYTVFDDSYNASEESVLADMRLFKFFPKENRAALLGDIYELGEKTEAIHEKIGFMAAKLGFCKLYLIGKYSFYYYRGALKGGLAPSKIFINPDPFDQNKTADHIQTHHSKNEVILFKGSHKARLHRVLEILKKKEGETEE